MNENIAKMVQTTTAECRGEILPFFGLKGKGPISSVVPPLLHACPEADNVVLATRPGALSAEFGGAAALAESDVVLPSGVPALPCGAVWAAELEAVAPLSVALLGVEHEEAAALAEPAAAVPLSAALLAVEHEGVAALAAGSEAAVVSELQVSADIAVVFVALFPVSVAAAGAGSSERPRSLAFPSVDCFANASSSVGLVAEGSVDSPTGARANFGLCSTPSNPGLYQNKNLEHFYNNPNPGYNNVSDTNDLPIGATTSRSRRTNLRQCQERHKHTCQATLSTAVVQQLQSAVASQH